MAFLNITGVYTADPADVWTPKSSFVTSDPFAIVVTAQCDSSLVAEGLSYDGVVQIVNPRQDPYTDNWWTFDGDNVFSMPTVDNTGTLAFQWTNFGFWWTWDRYSDAVSQINGPTIQGVYYVQGTMSVEGSNLFAASGQFWFKVR